MIDKLFLTTDNKIVENLGDIFKNSQISFEPSRYYKKGFTVRCLKGNHLLTILSSPKLTNNKQAQIQINPSNWNHISEINEILGKITSIDELNISRIDICCDLDIKFDDLNSKFIFKHKKNVLSYRDGHIVTGLLAGSKPELICIYDKAYQIRNGYKFNLARNKHIQLGEKSRIEVRKFGRKIPFKRYIDLKEYLKINPFCSIRLLDIKEQYEVEKAHQEKISLIRELTKKASLHSLSKELNKHNNFNRNSTHYLKTSELQEELYQKHINDLKLFLGE